MKTKFVISREGGGAKTEVRTGKHQGWLVLEFTYDDDGVRRKAGAKQSAADGFVVSLLKQDPEFYEKLIRLLMHPDIIAEMERVEDDSVRSD